MGAQGKRRVLLAALALVCVSSGTAMAANKLIVKGTDGTTDKFVVTESGYIGVGNSAPTFALHVIGTTSLSSGVFFHNTNTGVVSPAAGSSPGMNFYRNNDSSVNPTWPANNQLKAGDRMGYFSFGTKVGTTNKDLTLFQSYAESLHTPTSLASNLVFYTTSTNAVAPSEKLRLKADGMLEVTGSIRMKGTVAAGKPSCGVANRGLIWYVTGVTGTGATADTLEVCKKGATDSYAWTPLF